MDAPPSSFEVAWFFLSLMLLGVWLRRTHFGHNAFDNAPQRPHSLSVVDVLLVALAYFLVAACASSFLGSEETRTPQQLNLGYLALDLGSFLLAGTIIVVGAKRFRGGLSGFGLAQLPWPRTLLLAVVTFFVSTGLAILTLFVTVAICKQFGYEQTQKHTILETLGENPPGLTVVLLIVSAVLTAPLVEELLFRGILQSYLIRLISRPPNSPLSGALFVPPSYPGDTINKFSHRWVGIVLASLMFAALHNWQHVPALFVFSLCLGYVYERYGNLLIPIIAHSLFNTLHIALTLLSLAPDQVSG